MGTGNSALAVFAALSPHHSPYQKIIGTTRQPLRQMQLAAQGIDPFLLLKHDTADNSINQQGYAADCLDQLRMLAADADVLVSFPPDGDSDRQLAPIMSAARSLVYVSSTGVYGSRQGLIDETTAVDYAADTARPRLEAEAIWRRLGGVVLRAPALYGQPTGLHIRLKESTYRLPIDSSNFISRIHLDDLAQIILAAFRCALPGTIYTVGDLEPARHIDVVNWLCEKMHLPLPAMAASPAAYRLRSNRCVSAARVLRELGVTLRYPTYREGYSQCLSAGAII